MPSGQSPLSWHFDSAQIWGRGLLWDQDAPAAFAMTYVHMYLGHCPLRHPNANSTKRKTDAKWEASSTSLSLGQNSAPKSAETLRKTQLQPSNWKRVLSLIHIRQISRRHLAKSRQTFFEGRPITASVSEVSHAHRAKQTTTRRVFTDRSSTKFLSSKFVNKC